MKLILASFTRAEQRLLLFILAIFTLGSGLQYWQESRKQYLHLDLSAMAPVEKSAGMEVRPKGLTVDGKVDVNLADAELLDTLPGVGPAMSRAILEHRKTHGAFASMADLDRVPGVGPAMMAKLAPLVSFGGAEATGAPPALPPGATAVTSSAPPAAAGNRLININTATAEELDELVGVGPALARRIIAYRQQNGPFRSPADLQLVSGIGPKLLEKNQGRITVR